jgi:phage gp45-like
MFKRVDSVLPDRVNRLKVKKPADTDAVLAATNHALGEIWNHAVPMRATGFRAGRATVAVISAAWGHEIALREERIIELANQRLKKQAVKEIRATVSPEQAEHKPE